MLRAIPTFINKRSFMPLSGSLSVFGGTGRDLGMLYLCTSLLPQKRFEPAS